MTRWWGRRRARAALGAALLCGLTGLSLVAGGCKPTDSQMTKDEEENFKGGPMPPGFLEQQGGANRAAGAPPGAPAAPNAPLDKTPAK